MKSTKSLIILSLFLTATGCSDFYNWLSEDLDRMDLEQMETGQYEQEGEDEKAVETKIYFDDEEEYIDPYKDTEIEKSSTNGNQAYFDDEEKYVDQYKDVDIEKRDAYGNKTYYEKKEREY